MGEGTGESCCGAVHSLLHVPEAAGAKVNFHDRVFCGAGFDWGEEGSGEGEGESGECEREGAPPLDREGRAHGGRSREEKREQQGSSHGGKLTRKRTA